MDSPLEIQNVSKYYGEDVGVKDVSASIKTGEIFGFLGPNGAGKTTTIRLILDFIRPTEGAIKVFGQDSVEDSLPIKKKIGYLAGDIALYPDLKGIQLLQYMTALGRETDWEYVTQLADMLEAQLDKPIGDLSKGNKQKIGLLQAFMHRPDLVVLDEPTSGLDPLMQRVFYQIVEDARDDGKTVFLSSHNLHEVQRLCDRAAFIRQGRLIGVEDIKKLEALSLRRYRIRFNEEAPTDKLEQVDNVSEVERDELYANSVNLAVSGSPQSLLKELSRYEVLDLGELETSLEDVFMHYYDEEPS